MTTQLTIETMVKIKELIEKETGVACAFMVIAMTQAEHDRVHAEIHNPENDEVVIDYTSNVANIHPCVMATCFAEMWGAREERVEH